MTVVKEAGDRAWEKEAAIKAAASERAARAGCRAGVSAAVATLAATALSEAATDMSRLWSARNGSPLSIYQLAKEGDGTRGASELRGQAIYGRQDEGAFLMRYVHPDAREIRSDGSSCPAALAEAAMGGHLPFVEMLLEHGADVDLQEFDALGKPGEGTALHYAARHGHPRVVSCLLQHGASTMARNEDGRTALEWCRPYLGRDDPDSRGVLHLLSLTTPPLRTWWDGTLPASAALAIQFRCGEPIVDCSESTADCSESTADCSEPSGSGLTCPSGFHQLDGDLLRLVACWLGAEDANQLARTSLGLYAVSMQYERSERLKCSACLAQLRTRPAVALDVVDAIRVLREMQSVPLCRVAMEEHEHGARARAWKGSWGIFDSLLRLLGGSSSVKWGSGQWPGDAAARAVLALMASLIDSKVKMQYASSECESVESTEHANGLHWLSQLVAYLPVAAEACQLVEKLCNYDRTSDTVESCGYITKEIMEARGVEAIVQALQYPSACAAAAYALAAVICDEIGASMDMAEVRNPVTRAIGLGAVPLLLAQAVAAELVAATAALHALGTLCSASHVTAKIAHRDGFISTLVRLMTTHAPSKQRGHKAQRLALVAEAARTLRHLVGDTNGCDELASDLRCEEMLTAGARDALDALLAYPGAAGEAEAAMTWLPLPHILEQSTTYTWLQAGAPQDGDDTADRFRETLMQRLATDCIELGLRVPELVHSTTEHWSLAHDVYHGRYHKVRRAVIEAANLALKRRGGEGILRSIYYRLDEKLEEGEGNIIGAVLGTEGRILCYVGDELQNTPMLFTFSKREHDGVVECFAGET